MRMATRLGSVYLVTPRGRAGDLRCLAPTISRPNSSLSLRLRFQQPPCISKCYSRLASYQRLLIKNVSSCNRNSFLAGDRLHGFAALFQRHIRLYSPSKPSPNARASSKPLRVVEEDKAAININSPQSVKNSACFKKTEDMYRQAEAVALAGGGEKSMERHVKKHGKMMVTDRVRALIDDMDDFLELSLIGGVGMPYGHVPRANYLNGIGKIHGTYCMVCANDGSFKGGAIYPISVTKGLRTQEICFQNRVPSVMIVDSAGGFLPLQADLFNNGGATFYNEAVAGSEGIPQIAIVCGSCTAGGAYIPTMADEAVIVHKIGSLYLGGPPLVQAALGEIVSSEDLGGATVHCGTSGCTDYFASSEPEAFEIGRDIISCLNVKCNNDLDVPDFDEPLYNADEIPCIIPTPDSHHEMDVLPIIARLVDGSRFHEFKNMFGKCLLTGFAHICGHLVGIVANQQGDIGEFEAAKGSHFVQMCSERGIPLVFLQNTTDEQSEVSNKDEAVLWSQKLKARANMLAAVSCAKVPKLTVILGNGFGSTHFLMGGRAVNPNFLFAWPNARVAIMEPTRLAETVARQNDSSGKLDPDKLKKLTEKFVKESSAIYGATRILNDGIIMPNETRKVLSQCLAICKAYAQPRSEGSPVLRM
ncbi:methylcrotonoyl-CoA carboxylase beta chain, mitochondrial [Aplysia californica]|uniref:methylcrotonoyl-CoA carboxylase n=1 Tax=Aplysia californica TaxID=6500 RepID=A0ABM0ZZZ2_APLCA|nr:methylcrotonoyl-CoA carboxylase beta chain, mitochondrial [Aplysia californica]